MVHVLAASGKPARLSPFERADLPDTLNDNVTWRRVVGS